jgi:Raf kinase inhibitor-like YbhB/YbcL family protein
VRSSTSGNLSTAAFGLVAILLGSHAIGGTMMTLNSSAFADQGEIPTQYTCEGSDVSPPLSWTGVPAGTKSLALIVDDPDAPDPKAPKVTWVHWVLFNLPSETTSLAENASARGLPAGAKQGTNDFKKNTYGGPCPPIGRHRYYFKLYALDTTLDANRIATKPDLEKAMSGHTLATAQRMGTYQKKK